MDCMVLRWLTVWTLQPYGLYGALSNPECHEAEERSGEIVFCSYRGPKHIAFAEGSEHPQAFETLQSLFDSSGWPRKSKSQTEMIESRRKNESNRDDLSRYES